jgi:hypothetical protein
MKGSLELMNKKHFPGLRAFLFWLLPSFHDNKPPNRKKEMGLAMGFAKAHHKINR